MMTHNNTVLVIAAHADDEILGCGGTIAKHVSEGDIVHILFLSDGVSSRDKGNDTALDERKAMAVAAGKLLGTKPPIFLDFPDNRLDTVPLLEIVKKVETMVSETKPEIVYTHSNSDLNIDHRITHQATLTACRPVPGSSVRGIFAFEVRSSTEWGEVSVSSGFRPTRFVDISGYKAEKRKALECYSAELRDFPHPRSFEAIEALSIVRGSTVSVSAAEAFEVIHEIIL